MTFGAQPRVDAGGGRNILRKGVADAAARSIEGQAVIGANQRVAVHLSQAQWRKTMGTPVRHRADGARIRPEQGNPAVTDAAADHLAGTKFLAPSGHVPDVAQILGHGLHSSKMATARVQPAEAPLILCGKQLTVKPSG